MAFDIYAVAHIGHLKFYICEANKIHSTWPPLFAQLNTGTYPNAMLQKVWNEQGGKRYFTFHTRKELESDQEIFGLEKLPS